MNVLTVCTVWPLLNHLYLLQAWSCYLALVCMLQAVCTWQHAICACVSSIQFSADALLLVPSAAPTVPSVPQFFSHTLPP